MKCDTIPELEHFLKIQEQAMGASSAEVATTASKLGDLYFAKGNLEAAESFYKRTLGIRKGLHGVHRKEQSEAEERLLRVKLARTKKGGLSAISRDVDHNLVGVKPENSFGSDYTSLNSYIAKSVQCSISPPVLQSSTAFGAISSDRLPALATASSGIARPNITNPNLVRDAIREAELEVDLLKQMGYKEHPGIADMLTRLADLYCRLKLYSKMEPLLVESLRIREACCGPNHLSVSTELKNLARLYVAQERYALAEPLFRRALAIRESVCGNNHLRVADIKEHYAMLLRKMNRVKQAEDFERHAVAIRHGSDSVNSSTQKHGSVF